MSEKTYIAIDLKSFYASVECTERGLDPMITNLVVADESRTEKTICLAVSPSLKAYGIPGRARLFEVVQRVKQVNNQRQRECRGFLLGESYDDNELKRDKSLAVSYIVAPPQMAHYMEVSTQIYNIYLRYIAPEDIHVYSIDEVFIDTTGYLSTYDMTARELTMKLIREVLQETGITATAGIGTNMYLAKIAMDIVAKHNPADENGVRIAELDEMSYRRQLWSHRPLTDFWRVGQGYAKKLEERYMFTMGDIAECSIYNEDLLYKLFGVNAELLIDHAWGWEPCTIADIKAYKPAEHSVGSGQVLTSVTLFGTARLIAKEMAETLALDLVSKGLKTNRVALAVGYDTASLDPGRLDAGAPIELKRAAEAAAASYTGPVGTDYYGRRVPKAVSGSVDLGGFTSSASTIRTAIDRLFCRLVDSRLLVRRLNVTALDVATPTELAAGKRYEQPDLFSAASGGDDAQTGSGERGSHGVADERSEQAVQQALLDIKRKFGKNSVIKAMDMFDGATGQQRNNQIGGHAA